MTTSSGNSNKLQQVVAAAIMRQVVGTTNAILGVSKSVGSSGDGSISSGNINGIRSRSDSGGNYSSGGSRL